MFTCEFTHKGIRRQMCCPSDDERLARIAFSQQRKRANDVLVIHDETIKRHATKEDMLTEVKRFRVEHGKTAELTDEEIRRNGIEVLCDTVQKSSTSEDDVWW